MNDFIQLFQTEFTEILIKNTKETNIKIEVCGIEIPVGNDSKLISKIIDNFIILHLIKYCNKYNINFKENDIQNKYPDFIMYYNDKPIAIDIKTSYLLNDNNINGFTLGSYNGYFRDRKSLKNTMYLYDDYIENLCICITYNRKNSIKIENCFIKSKWMIASKKVGSGNTKNIGSIKNIFNILSNNTIFSSCNEFENYWINYKK